MTPVRWHVHPEDEPLWWSVPACNKEPVTPDARTDAGRVNVVPKLSRTPGAVRWVEPQLGGHNDDILGDLNHI